MSAARDSVSVEADLVRKSARQLVSPAEVGAALDRMARAAAEVIARENPLVLAVMNGGAFTAVELCQRWDFPFELDFVHVTRYGQNLQGGELSWRAWPDRELAGRTVLVVDDIVDNGDTLAAICERLQRGGAGPVHTAILVVKRLEKTPAPRAAAVPDRGRGFRRAGSGGCLRVRMWHGLQGLLAGSQRDLCRGVCRCR